MTTAMSKRTQVRNEKALQELIKTVPGNDRCADCAARNPGISQWFIYLPIPLANGFPGWASWSVSRQEYEIMHLQQIRRC